MRCLVGCENQYRALMMMISGVMAIEPQGPQTEPEKRKVGHSGSVAVPGVRHTGQSVFRFCRRC